MVNELFTAFLKTTDLRHEIKVKEAPSNPVMLRGKKRFTAIVKASVVDWKVMAPYLFRVVLRSMLEVG
jgi:hypothetical protein